MRDGDFRDIFFISLLNTTGKTRERGLQRAYLSLGSKHHNSNVTVFAGTILVPLSEKTDLSKSLDHGRKLLLKPFESENIEIEFLPADINKTIKRISYEEVNLLAPIPTCEERLKVYLDGDGYNGWLKEGLQIRVDDLVKVRLRGHTEDVLGVVKYKGLFPKEARITGTHFGVYLRDNRGEGNSDGYIHGKKLFSCETNSAIFVPVNKVRLVNSELRMSTRGYGSSSTVSLQPPRAKSPVLPSSKNIPNCNLKIDDEVIWISDVGPEEAVVKWIGQLPGAKRTDITVGVEFKNPVGSGTGKYKDTRLFYAKLNHASLMPILGLIKKDELLGQSGNTENSLDDSEELRALKEESLLEYNRQQRLLDLPNRLTPSPQPPPVAERRYNLGATGYDPEPNYIDGRESGLPSPSSSEEQAVCRPPSSFAEKLDPDPDLTVGSLVEVLGNPPVYGLIRWIGTVPDQKDPQKKIAGLEMDDEISAGTDGTFNNIRLFTCPPRRAFFVPLYKCRKDKRFLEQANSLNFGSKETPDISGDISPPSSLEDPDICGKHRGIQGHHNSCYLDATLFAMFYFTTVFDSIFYRDRRPNDPVEYEQVQKVLKEGIVNPLRRQHYVRADKVMKLRGLLDKLSSVSGLLSEEKDPEEFLNSLLTQIMKPDPFLKLRSGSVVSESYYYQLFMDHDEKLKSPTTQNLLELSFLQSDIKLAEIPSCLILQMPRFGKSYKMFKRILPSLELNITDLLEEAPRECVICGDLATFECKDCFKLNTFCQSCNTTNHKHMTRVHHKPRPIKVCDAFRAEWQKQQQSHEPVCIPQQKMELFAVVCIETSHYVSFVKAGKQWVFFDSMADRKGGNMGYNIPEVVEVQDLPEWLSRDIDNYPDDKDLPEHIRRLVSDAYMCIYQDPQVMMFK